MFVCVFRTTVRSKVASGEMKAQPINSVGNELKVADEFKSGSSLELCKQNTRVNLGIRSVSAGYQEIAKRTFCNWPQIL
jgi:hypothetical protein